MRRSLDPFERTKCLFKGTNFYCMRQRGGAKPDNVKGPATAAQPLLRKFIVTFVSP
jgi:hypothetical protein